MKLKKTYPYFDKLHNWKLFDWTLGFNNLKQLSFIGGADVIGNGVTAIFWFFLASQISPDEYGQIFYFIGIASIAGAFVIVGAQNSILVYAAKNIKMGDIFTKEMISVKGPGGGLLPKYLDVVIGRKAALDVFEDHPITWDSI